MTTLFNCVGVLTSMEVLKVAYFVIETDGNGNVFIYRTYHIVSWRFTILLWGEIGRQHVKVPLAAAISPYFDLTHPPNPRMNVKD